MGFDRIPNKTPILVPILPMHYFYFHLYEFSLYYLIDLYQSQSKLVSSNNSTMGIYMLIYFDLNQ